eukprot:ANDGO_06119.mRNA.1 Hypothetical protein TTHERM_01321540
MSSGTGPFPDLHHKMCKKIAQLTKVIYQLNTRNDDHEFELDHLTNSYESEIEDILRDASNRINSFKNDIEKTRSAAKTEDALRLASERFALEKKEAFSQFEQFKRQMESQLALKENDFERKVLDMSKMLNSAKEEFSKRVSGFSEASAKGTDASKALEALKLKHAEELKKIVTEYNEKYNYMLAQQLQTREDERERLEKEFVARQRDAIDKALQDQLSKHKYDLESEQRQKRALIEEHTAEIQRLHEQLEAAKLDIGKCRLEMKAALEQATQSHEKSMTRMQLDLEAERQLSLQRASKLTESEVKVGELKHLLESRLQEIDSLRMQAKSLQAGASSLQEELASENTRLVNELKIVRLDLQDAQKAYASSEAECLRLRKEAERASLAHEERIQQLELEWRKAQDSSMDALARKHSQTVKDLQQRVAELLESLERLKADNADQQSQWDKEKLRLQDEYRNKIKSLESSSGDSFKELSEKIGKLENEKRALLKEMMDAAENARQSFEAEVESLKRRLAQTDKDFSDCRASLQLSQSRVAALEADLASSRAEGSKSSTELQSQLSELKLRFSNAESAHEMTLQKQKQDHASEKSQLEAAWQKKMEDATKAFSEELRSVRDQLSLDGNLKISDLQQKMQGTIDALRAELHDAEVGHAKKLDEAEHSWKQQIANEQDVYSRKLTGLQIEHARVLEGRAAEFEREIEELRRAHATKIEVLETRIRDLENSSQNRSLSWDREKIRLQESFAEQLKMREEQLVQQHSNELQDIKDKERRKRESQDAEHQKRMDDMLSAHQQEIRSAETIAAAKLNAELESMRAQLENLREVQLRDLGDSLRASADIERRKFEEQLAIKEDFIKGLQRDLRTMETSSVGLQKTISKLEQDQKDLCGSHAAAMEKMEDRTRELVHEKERESAARLSKMEDRHKNITEKMRDEFEHATEALDQKNAILEQKIMELELRYENRESRTEDVERIRHLEHECREQEKIARKAVENMQFYKLELQNREDTFQRTFGRSPNVGVMNPLQSSQGSNSAPAQAMSTGSLAAQRKAMNSASSTASSGSNSSSGSQNGSSAKLPPLDGTGSRSRPGRPSSATRTRS